MWEDLKKKNYREEHFLGRSDKHLPQEEVDLHAANTDEDGQLQGEIRVAGVSSIKSRIPQSLLKTSLNFCGEIDHLRNFSTSLRVPGSAGLDRDRVNSIQMIDVSTPGSPSSPTGRTSRTASYSKVPTLWEGTMSALAGKYFNFLLWFLNHQPIWISSKSSNVWRR